MQDKIDNIRKKFPADTIADEKSTPVNAEINSFKSVSENELSFKIKCSGSYPDNIFEKMFGYSQNSTH